MNIKVYTKRRCSFCTAAKSWLNQRNYTFEEISLDDPVLKEEFTSKHPDLRTVPQIFVDNDNIGGFSDLIKSHLA